MNKNIGIGFGYISSHIYINHLVQTKFSSQNYFHQFW